MPNPKRRHSKTRTAKRRTHDALTAVGLSECPHCHEAHDISVRDTYIEVVAQEDSDRLYRFR